MSNIMENNKSLFNIESKSFNNLLKVSIIACFAVVLTKIIFTFIYGSELSLVTGAWVGLAMDLRDGIFYRPLYSEATGFGGTRFFPLFFTIHALLMKVSGTTFISGYIISIFSGLLLLGACYRLLRKMEIESTIIFGLIALLVSTFSIQLGFVSIRSDILPVALNIIGIAFILSDYDIKYKRILASLFFVLAFSAKVTAVSGLVSVFLWLVLNKRMKDAFWILLLTASGYVLFIAGLYLATSGRIYTIFTECSSGGANLLTAISAPFKFSKKIIKYDIVCMLSSLWAMLVICRYKKALIKDLFFLFWLFSILITVFIFTSPGTEYNHIVDVTVASVLLTGSMIYQNKFHNKKLFMKLFSVLLIFAVVYNAFWLSDLIIDKNKHVDVKFPKEIVDVCRSNNGIVIAERPILPVLANKKPYVLDSFMLRILVTKDNDIKMALLDGVNQRKYSAIIFSTDPLINMEERAYFHYGREFIQAVVSYYKVGIRNGDFVVYFPDYYELDKN